MPANEIPLAWFSFNVGIEIGQIAFVVVVLLAGLLWRPGVLGAALRDYGRYGLMMANGGRSNGRQVVSSDWVADATTADRQAVEYGNLYAIKLEYTLLVIIDYSSRRSDQDINAFRYDAPLLLVICAAECKSDLESRMSSEDFGVLGRLHGKLARRREH